MRLEPSAPRSRKVRVGRLGMRRGTGSVSRYAAPDNGIAASPTSTPNNGKAPRYAKSRRGPSAQTGKGQKERHLVSVYPRAWFPWRKVSLQIDIAPRGCSAPTKSERSPEAGIATPRQSNPLCRCAPSSGEVNIILVVTSTLRVRRRCRR